MTDTSPVVTAKPVPAAGCWAGFSLAKLAGEARVATALAIDAATAAVGAISLAQGSLAVCSSIASEATAAGPPEADSVPVAVTTRPMADTQIAGFPRPSVQALAHGAQKAISSNNNRLTHAAIGRRNEATVDALGGLASQRAVQPGPTSLAQATAFCAVTVVRASSKFSRARRAHSDSLLRFCLVARFCKLAAQPARSSRGHISGYRLELEFSGEGMLPFRTKCEEGFAWGQDMRLAQSSSRLKGSRPHALCRENSSGQDSQARSERAGRRHCKTEAHKRTHSKGR